MNISGKYTHSFLNMLTDNFVRILLCKSRCGRTVAFEYADILSFSIRAIPVCTQLWKYVIERGDERFKALRLFGSSSPIRNGSSSIIRFCCEY